MRETAEKPYQQMRVPAADHITAEVQRGKWYWFGAGARSSVLEDSMYRIARSYGYRHNDANHFIAWLSGENGKLDSKDFH